MNVLGIETSCDETAASVVKDGKYVLSNVVVSSLKDHQKYGGIIPEIASRLQLEYIHAIVDRALKEANVKLQNIDAVAVTQEPGLIGSLLVGVSFARSLSFALRKPLIPVDHIKAHLYANFLKLKKNSSKAASKDSLPAVGLVVSGGHTSLYLVKDFKHFKLLGHTLDDAAGEAFDKVAKILGLSYPGGPVIDRLAKEGKKTELNFSCAELPGTLNFSFSGIKTAILYYQRDKQKNGKFSVAEVAYAFQKSVVKILVKKCLLACEKLKTKTLLIGGGVAANSCLRSHLDQMAQKYGLDVYCPPLPFCMDNAAMIAGLGYQLNSDKRNQISRRFDQSAPSGEFCPEGQNLVRSQSC